MSVTGTGRDDRSDSLSGLSEPEAREFHGVFMTSFIIFVLIAIVAHFLVWQWRPWLPGPDGYRTALDGVTVAMNTLTSFIA